MKIAIFRFAYIHFFSNYFHASNMRMWDLQYTAVAGPGGAPYPRLPTSMPPPPSAPNGTPILSFLHTFLPKSACIGHRPPTHPNGVGTLPSPPPPPKREIL